MAPAPKKADSVYDFLYFDLPRIQLFNSQFSQYGHITELTRSTSASSSTGGGFDVKVAKAEATEGEKTEISKKYSTQFIEPLTFLDRAQNMIVRDVAKAGIGQFVLCTGSLRILDLLMLRAAWEQKSVQKLVSDGVKEAQSTGQNRQDRRAQKQTGSEFGSTLAMMFDMLRLMPHGIQGQLQTQHQLIWSAMRAEGFITQPSDLLLNHGAELTGTWNVVGILDATPAATNEEAAESADPTANSQSSLVGNLAITIQPLARQLLGRPESAFGVTPLIIFREVHVTT